MRVRSVQFTEKLNDLLRALWEGKSPVVLKRGALRERTIEPVLKAHLGNTRLIGRLTVVRIKRGVVTVRYEQTLRSSLLGDVADWQPEEHELSVNDDITISQPYPINYTIKVDTGNG